MFPHGAPLCLVSVRAFHHKMEINYEEKKRKKHKVCSFVTSTATSYTNAKRLHVVPLM